MMLKKVGDLHSGADTHNHKNFRDDEVKRWLNLSHYVLRKMMRIAMSELQGWLVQGHSILYIDIVSKSSQNGMIIYGMRRGRKKHKQQQQPVR